MYLGAQESIGRSCTTGFEGLFTSEHSWRNACEIEQLLCFVLTEAKLASELDRRHWQL